MENEQNIINFDFQGWPVYKKSIKEIIKAFGAEYNKETDKWEIPNDPKVLDIYPRILEDDGMGYGANEKYITDIECRKELDYCNVWGDIELQNAKLYQEAGLYPGQFFNMDGKEYVVNDITDGDDGTKVLSCGIWQYEEINGQMQNPIIGMVDFDLNYALEHMEKQKPDEIEVE